MATITEKQPVNIEVNSIKEADREGFYKISINFTNSPKVYDYVRKCGKDSNGNRFVIISGCRITFSEFCGECKLISITREYNVKGYRRRSTESQSKKKRKKSSEQQKPLISANSTKDDDIEKLIDEVDDEEQEETSESTKEEEEVVTFPKKIRHEKYELIKSCLDENIPIYLAGPAGSGKNYTVEQIARENGWNFYYTNSVQQEYKLTGFIDAGGNYNETEFYKACTDTEECIFFLDEMDASIPEALVLINAAIANGYFEFPNGRVNLGDVHFIAAGNTVGSGADELYTGRMVLDQATLDRFAIIEFDYSKPIELKLTNNNNELVDFVHDLRDKAKSNGIRATFSYRCLIMVTKLEKTGLSLNDILTISVLKGMDKDTINTLRLFGTGKYYDALSIIQRGY